MNITKATAADINDIAHIHVDGWRSSYGGIIDQGYIDSKTIEDRIALWTDIFEKDETTTLLARDENGTAAGFVSFGKIRTAPPGMSPIRPLYTAEIYAIYILQDYWRKGLGKQLMKAASDSLQGDKHQSVCLWVLEKNKNANAFYKAIGGERCGKIDVEFGPTKAREVCYGWRKLKTIDEA